MADVVTRLKLESGEYDSKLKRAVQGLLQMEQGCRSVNGTLNVLEKDQMKYVQSLGRMETVSRTVRGRVNELSSAYVEFSGIYHRLTADEKNGEFGKALNQQLAILRDRVNSAKKELTGINAELNGGAGVMGKLSTGAFDAKSMLQDLGGQLGINTTLLSGVTAGTLGFTAAVGAMIAAEVKAIGVFAEYNSELSKQSQITSVTTGLKGPMADTMTADARSISKVYGVDFREVINAANTLMTQFGQSGEQSIQLIRDGMQGMVMGDGPKLLSMIQQFAPSFRDAGISASQLVAIIHNSEGGIFTDQNMNAIVMGIRNIRLMTKATNDALRQIGIDGSSITRQLNEGTIGIFDALRMVSEQLEHVETGSQAAGNVMQQVFGRQGTMAGTNLSKAIATLNLNLEETKWQTDSLGESIAALERAESDLERANMKLFGVSGWDEMINIIKGGLYTALASVIDQLGTVYNTVDTLTEKLSTEFGNSGKVTSYMLEWATTMLTPLGILREMVKLTKQLTGAGSMPTDGSGRQMQGFLDNLRKAPGQKTATVIMNRQEEAYNKAIFAKSDRLRITYDELAKIGKSEDAVTRQLEKEIGELRKNRDEYLRQAREIISGMKYPGRKTSPTAPTPPADGTNTAHTTTPQQRSAEKYKQAQKDYNQALEQAALEVKAGTITTAEAKRKELQATEGLWKSIGDAREIYDTPELKEAQEKTAEDVVRLGGELSSLTEEYRQQQEAARNLKTEQERAARELQQRREMEESWKTASQGSFSSFKADLLKRQSAVGVGTEQFNQLQANIVDVTTLNTLINTALKNGITIDPEVPQAIFEQIVSGKDIKTDVFSTMQDELNERLKEMNIDPLNIDFSTGESRGRDKKSGSDTSKQLMSGVNQIASGLQQMGVVFPDGVQKFISVTQGVISIIEGISAIISITQTTALTANTIAMGLLTQALWANTLASAIPFFSNGGVVPAFNGGGVVRAAMGFTVPGNRMSGDQVPALLNSGEVVLNRAQVGNLSSQMTDSPFSSLDLGVVFGAEEIRLILNNNGRRTGRGEYVQTNRRRR